MQRVPLLHPMSIADLTNQSRILFPTEPEHSFRILLNPGLATTNCPKMADEIKFTFLLDQFLHCAGGAPEANHPSSHTSDAKPR